MKEDSTLNSLHKVILNALMSANLKLKDGELKGFKNKCQNNLDKK